MPLHTPYFRFRDRFDFSPDRYAIGNAIIQNKAHADNFFLKKMYALNEEEYAAYYGFHLHYFLENLPEKKGSFSTTSPAF